MKQLRQRLALAAMILLPMPACSLLLAQDELVPSDSSGTGANGGEGGEGPRATGGSGAGNSTGSGGTGGGSNGTGGEGSGGDSGVGGTPLSGPPYGHPNAEATYPEYSGFTLYLVEEFESALDLEADPIWTYSDGAPPEGDVRFVKEGVQFDDGKLILEVKSEVGSGYTYDECSHAEHRLVTSKTLVSGELRTRYNMFRYGRYEARLKAPSPDSINPATNGNYIASFFTFRDPSFEEWREIDFMLTGDAENAVSTDLVVADNGEGWSPDTSAPQGFTPTLNARTAFHDYAIEWLPDSITWLIDGEVIREYTDAEALPIPDLSAKIRMNLWVFSGGLFGGSEIENNIYPLHAEYEWFRFYKWDDDSLYPCDELDTDCLTDEDLNLSSNNPCDGQDPTGETACTAPCN